MEQAVIEALVSGGAVAVLAGIIFLMYRRDRESSEKRIVDICLGHENRLREDRQSMVNMIEKDQETREKETEALTALKTTLDRMNGHR